MPKIVSTEQSQETKDNRNTGHTGPFKSSHGVDLSHDKNRSYNYAKNKTATKAQAYFCQIGFRLAHGSTTEL